MSMLIIFRPRAASTVYSASFSETWSVSEALSKRFKMKTFSETWQASEVFLKKIKKIFSENWQVGEAIKKGYKRIFAESWQATEDFAKKIVFHFSFSETWQASEAIITKWIKKIPSLQETWQAVETFGQQYIAAGIVEALGFLRRIFTKQS